MRIKLNVPHETEMLFLVKCDVTASMRKIIYHVHIHLSQLSGSVLYGNCNCKSGLAGCCKHVAAALYQLIDFKMCGVKSIPGDKTLKTFFSSGIYPESKNKPMQYHLKT